MLELTESALMDDVAGVREIFEALRALGVAGAIDDFGTGFSSLATLADLPIVAEGVEPAEKFEALRALGCRWAQGYHLGRPAPLATLFDERARALR